MSEFIDVTLKKAKASEMEAHVDARFQFKDQPFASGKVLDARVRAVTASVLESVAEDLRDRGQRTLADLYFRYSIEAIS